MTPPLISVLAAFFYFTSGLLLLRRLAKMRDQVSGKGVALSIGFLALGLHAWLLLLALPDGGSLRLSFFNMISLVSGCVVLLLLTAAMFRPVANLGIALLPMAGVAVLLAQWNPEGGVPPTALAPELEMHIILSVVAYAILTIAALQAVVLAIQEAHLRNRHPGGLIRALPPMLTMEQMLFQLLALGFALLTLSLLSGFLFIDDLFAQHLVHKTVLSLTAWVVFAVLLWGRYRFGWRGRTAVKWTLAGFLFLMLAYFGSKMVLELLLNRV